MPRPSHPALNVRDDRETPLFSSAGWRELIEMICPTGIAKYFCEEDWTTQISLKSLVILVFWRRCDSIDEEHRCPALAGIPVIARSGSSEAIQHNNSRAGSLRWRSR
jgi:hypothetical protein